MYTKQQSLLQSEDYYLVMIPRLLQEQSALYKNDMVFHRQWLDGQPHVL